MPTKQDALNRSNPDTLNVYLRDINLGDVLDALRPRVTAFTGLTSDSTQVHDKASLILSVENVAGTPLSMVTGGTAGAGEISVDYDPTTGVPTFEFEGAVTAYIVNETGDFSTLITQLAAASASV